MSDHRYQDPVSKLLDYGQADPGDWPDYLSLGFTAEQIPDLIHLATDRKSTRLNSSHRH